MEWKIFLADKHILPPLQTEHFANCNIKQHAQKTRLQT